MNSLDHSLALGPLSFTLAQLLIIVALLVALGTGALLGRRAGRSVSDSLFNLLIISAIGARIVFVARYWESYDNLPGILDLRDGGFDPLGALGFGAAYLCWSFWRNRKNRAVLAGAVFAGALAWGMPTLAISLIDQHARPMPDTPLVTIEGEATSLPELMAERDKPLVVNIWATWCPPCRREMPVLEEAQQQHQDVVFAFVNHGEQSSQVLKYLREHSLSLDNVLMDTPGAVSSATGAMGLPTTLYYNSEGQLVDSHFGELSRATLQRGLDRLDPTD